MQSTTIVLFGAGASHGSGDVIPHVPPLGAGPEGLFSQLEAISGVASGLAEELKKIFRSNFEKGMLEYYRLTNGNIMAFQRELAAYLASFQTGPNNIYTQLIRVLGTERVIYSTLNYDLLFEIAGTYLELQPSYDRILRSNSVRLLKIHGSCIFGPISADRYFTDLSMKGLTSQSRLQFDH